MAMIKCPVCNADISTTDTKCINCGSDKSTIEFELKRRELIKEGKIEDAERKKKSIIIILELLTFGLIIGLYVVLFVPRIIEINNSNNQNQKVQKCTEQSGDWDSDLKDCIRTDI